MGRYAILFLLAAVSVLANGYHYATDDGAIFLPEIVQHLHPTFYPANAEFFHAHGSLSLFPAIASTVAMMLGGSIRWSLLALHLLGVFLLLASAFRLARLMFTSHRAAWSAVCLLACVTSVFVAGTSVPIMDPYFTARTLSTPVTLLAFVSAVSHKRLQAALALGAAFLLHPLMAVFALMLIGSYYATGLALPAPIRVPVHASLLPLGFGWGRVHEPYRQTMVSRTFFFAARWSWLEWTGALLPLGLVFYFWRGPVRSTTSSMRRVCGSAFLCGTAATLAFLLISLSPNLENFVRLQPMRAFQLIYILMFLVVGGFVGEYVLRAHAWRWSLLLLALGTMDVTIDRLTYPESAHVEWPSARSNNAWIQSFEWAQANTPQNALFALPPNYMVAKGEDMHGFRGISERSALADQIKDSGVVSMFPELAPQWKRQIEAQAGWNRFTAADFHRLAQQYAVTWVIVQLPQSSGLDCPYRNNSVAVCRIA